MTEVEGKVSLVDDDFKRNITKTVETLAGSFLPGQEHEIRVRGYRFNGTETAHVVDAVTNGDGTHLEYPSE